MSTKTTTKLKPAERVRFSDSVDSPRAYSTPIGYFVTDIERKISPDGRNTAHGDSEAHAIHNGILACVQQVKATETWSKPSEFAWLVRNAIETEYDWKDIAEVYPIAYTEHGDCRYALDHDPEQKSIHTWRGGDGVYVVFAADKTPPARRRELIAKELEEYTNWANGVCHALCFLTPDGKDEDGWYNHYGTLDEFNLKWLSPNVAKGLDNIDLVALYRAATTCPTCGQNRRL